MLKKVMLYFNINELFLHKEKYSMAKAIEINKKIKNPELYRRKKSEETSKICLYKTPTIINSRDRRRILKK